MTACIMQRSVDAHFGGAITPEEEQRLRAHLPGCARCSKRYERRLLLASLDPEAPAPVDRLAHALGIAAREATPQTRRGSRLSGAVLVLAAAAAALLLVWTRPSPDAGFASRGGAATDAEEIFVYRSRPGGAPTPAAGRIARGDELAFAYANPAKKAQLLVFGIDEHGHVFWYHPAWTDPAQDPASIAIEGGPARRELREAIGQDLDGAKLEIHGLFLDAPLTVKALERSLEGRRAPLGPLALPGAIDHVVTLEVTP